MLACFQEDAWNSISSREIKMERFRNILCIVNPDEKASAVVQRAMGLAASHKTSLTLARVVESTPFGTANDAFHFADDQRTAARTKFEAENYPRVEKNGFAGKHDVVLLRGIPYEEIIKLVQRGNHDLLIKPVESSRNGRSRLRINDKYLLRECPCPVWLVKLTTHDKPDRILAALDSHPGESTVRLNGLILDLSTSVAVEENTELHAVCNWGVPDEKGMRSRVGTIAIRRLLAGIRRTHMQWLRRLTKPTSKHGMKFHVHLMKGKANDVILAEARKMQPDLIVMGTTGRVGIADFFFGSAPERILAQVDCSVLAVKPEGFRSTVAA